MAMSLTYDATGRKWKKDGEFGAVLYDGGIEYRDGQLEAINLPDGRMVAEYNGGSNITRYRAEYFHKDHLGNTRLAFSDFNQNGYIELTEEDPGTPENELEITQEAHYYPFGMGHMGPWYATVAPENKYLYNGKELNEDYGINLMDYGARWYDGALGRFTGVDPLAEERAWMTPYNYVQNNPILRIDPDGALDSPIFDKDGNFLGVDSEGYTGEIIIMDRTAFNTVSRINGNQPLNHDQVIIWAEKSPLASKLDDADLTPEAYSKILTDVLDEMPDVEVSELYNGEVSVLDRNRNASYNDPENVLGLAETTVTSKGIKVTANLYSGEGDSDLNTVTNIQNNLGAHEFIGHGKLGFGDKTRTHHKVYEFQMRHPTWDKTTKKYQRQMMDYYLDYRKRETGQ